MFVSIQPFFYSASISFFLIATSIKVATSSQEKSSETTSAPPEMFFWSKATRDASGSHEDSDETDEDLRTGLLESEPNSDSSGNTVPFHKVYQASKSKKPARKKTSWKDTYAYNFLKNNRNPFLDPSDTEPDQTDESDSEEIVKGNNGTGGKASTVAFKRRVPRQANLRKLRDPKVRSPKQSSMTPTCSAAVSPSEITSKPLMCYQCSSMGSNPDPNCDDQSWKFLRNSEKYALRIQCPETRGHYCVKSMGKKDHRVRTIRGCMGPGPIRTNLGTHIPLREGCATYLDKDYQTKTCFCKENLCNSADFGTGKEGSFISTLIVCLALFMYGFCYATVSRGVLNNY